MENKKPSVQLYAKLHKAKQSIGKVLKNATNPHFKKSYADINALLDTVEPALNENGLILLQPIQDKILRTQIICIETGQMVESWLTLPELIDPQKMISATTYYRRATLQSILSLQAVDDDGQSAKENVKKPSLSDEHFIKAQKAIEEERYTLIELVQNYSLSESQLKQLKK